MYTPSLLLCSTVNPSHTPPPTNVNATQLSPTSIHLSWSHPLGGQPFGYFILYLPIADNVEFNQDFESGSSDSRKLNNLDTVTYIITIVAVSPNSAAKSVKITLGTLTLIKISFIARILTSCRHSLMTCASSSCHQLFHMRGYPGNEVVCKLYVHWLHKISISNFSGFEMIGELKIMLHIIVLKNILLHTHRLRLPKTPYLQLIVYQPLYLPSTFPPKTSVWTAPQSDLFIQVVNIVHTICTCSFQFWYKILCVCNNVFAIPPFLQNQRMKNKHMLLHVL